MILWENKTLGRRRNSFSFFIATITFHHSELITVWKLSLRRTAELGFYPALSPPLPLFPIAPSPSFSHPLPLYLSLICNSSFLHLWPILLLFSSLLSFCSSAVVLFSLLLVFSSPSLWYFHCLPQGQASVPAPLHSIVCSRHRSGFSIKLAVIRKMATLGCSGAVF